MLDVKSPMKFLSINNTIQNNKIKSFGEVEMTETLFENDGIMDFQIKTCPTDKTCGTVMPIQIKELCRYLTSKSVFGNRFGDSFTPPMRCPVKPGLYRFNISINLKSFTKLPGAKFRTSGKMTVMEVLPNNRKRDVACIDATVYSKL